jgi:Glycosyl hydrolase-like 10
VILKPTKFLILGFLFKLISNLAISPVAAQSPLVDCRVSSDAALSKASLLQAISREPDQLTKQRYEQLVSEHSQALTKCRRQKQPAVLATWLRVYPCDLKPGSLEQTLDNIANLGYNRIYLNTFYDGRVLLPQLDNPTIWTSVVGTEAAKVDLLAEVIQKARQRGIKVYAWLYTLNFGSSYAKQVQRQTAIARNGFGETNLADPAALPEVKHASHVFVDPYSPQARQDFQTLVQAIAKRKPDGIAFDYVRYPQRTLPRLRDVRDLMIYSNSSFNRLLERALNPEAANLLYTYLAEAKVAKKLRSQPKWWNFPAAAPSSALNSKISLNQQLWQLVIAHAQQGIVEFLDRAIATVPKQISTAAVFFPKANQVSAQAVDPRLQPWDQFKQVSEWSPMLYSACGNTDCILEELALVVSKAENISSICPVIAGYWGQSLNDRPPLEVQMKSIYQAYPKLQCTSHFAYSWLDPELDRKRRTCR